MSGAALGTRQASAATPAHQLSEVERRKLVHLEGIVERGLQTFVEVGTALSVIREQRLYRDTHGTFEDYCQERWGWNRHRASQLITASDVVGSLVTNVTTLPENEGQARELAKTPEEQRAKVWQRAVDESEGKPTAAAIRRAAEEVAAKPIDRIPAPIPDDELEPERAEPDVDAVAEWEAAQREVERLEDLVETLKAGKAEEDLAALSRKYGQLEGRVRQLTTEANEAKRQAKSQGDLLRRIADRLGLERWGDILPAIEDLLR